MGSPVRVLSLWSSLYFLCQLSLALSDSNDCHLINCLKCDGSNGTQCTRCSQLVLRSKHCNEVTCPPGYHTRWTSLSDFMSSACLESGVGGGRLRGEVVGGAVGLVVCLTTAIAVAAYCRLRRGRRRRKTSKNPSSFSHSTQSSDESDREMAQYAEEIRELRPEAPVFLDMLNETRRQVRSLSSYSALQPYKPVLKDLSRILILLNRPENCLSQPPPDWETLLAWARRILARYKKHHSNQIQVKELELANFFQTEPSQFSTFDSNYNQRKRESCEYLDWDGTGTGTTQLSHLDDYFSLGLRPQDEITTEL